MGMITETVILQAIVYGLLNGSIYALISIGFTMIFGVMGIINFAYGQLMVVSMYITLFLYVYYRVDPFLSMVITMPLFFVVGIVMYKFAIQWMLKTPHHIQMVATLGVMIFLESIMLFMFKGDPRAITTSYTTSVLSVWGGVKISVPRLIATIISFAVISSLFLFLKRTILGKEIGATADNEEGAMLVGIETNTVFMIAFGIACVLEAIAGSSIMAFSVVDPYTGFQMVLKAWMVVILAGLGSIPGAIIGGLIVGIIEALSSVFISASLGTGLLFLILVLVLIFKPTGMFGAVKL
jgi:branched-chain amino acid transport system permease protein